MIERAISSTLAATDKSTHSRRHLIITHGNRYYASVLLNMVSDLQNSTIQLAPDSAQITANLAALIARTENYIEDNYPTAYPARFFAKEGANKRGNSSRLTQSFHFFMFEPIFSPVNALNQPI